jgi:uncharacterized protein YxjI
VPVLAARPVAAPVATVVAPVAEAIEPAAAPATAAVEPAATSVAPAKLSIKQPAALDRIFPSATISAEFDRDKFLLRQKAIAISDKYWVSDEHGNPLIYVERPALLLRQLTALICPAAVFLGWLFVFAIIQGVLVPTGTTIGMAVSITGYLTAFPLALLTFVVLIPKRHVTFYKDADKSQVLMEVLQENRIEFPAANFTIFDADGTKLGRLRKNIIWNLIRRRWYCESGNGLPLCVAKEDSILLSFLRRLLGPLFGFLRTNFIFLRGHKVVGEFNRKFTLLDRYVLDLTFDPERTIDRRVAVALGVMLDTGERR